MAKTFIHVAESHDDFDSARELLREYSAEIGGIVCFEDLRQELDQLEDRYAPPAGGLLLGMLDTTAVGCVGVQRVDAMKCEMKRLYVKPLARGFGLGRRLARAALESARVLGYHSMILDTLSSMQEAQSLYRSLGFRVTSGYYGKPVGEAIHMECDLRKKHVAH